MSTGISQPDSSGSPPVRPPHPAFASPMLRHTLITFAIAVVLGCVAYWIISKGRRDLEAKVQQSTNIPTGNNGSPSNRDSVSASAPLSSRPDSERLAIRRESSPEDWQAPLDMPGAELAYRRSRTTQALIVAAQTRNVIQDLRAASASWQKTHAPIVTSDAGRRIATSEPHLNLALSALQQNLTADDVIASWLIEIDQLAGPLERGELLENSHTDRIDSIRKIASTELEQLQAGRLVLDSVLKETAEFEPGKYKIEEILKQRRLAREKVRCAELVKAEEEEFAKGTAALVQAIRERTAKEIEIERKKIANDASSYSSR